MEALQIVAIVAGALLAVSLALLAWAWRELRIKGGALRGYHREQMEFYRKERDLREERKRFEERVRRFEAARHEPEPAPAPK